jgi:hypothetical protein
MAREGSVRMAAVVASGAFDGLVGTIVNASAAASFIAVGWIVLTRWLSRVTASPAGPRDISNRRHGDFPCPGGPLNGSGPALHTSFQQHRLPVDHA